MRTIAIINQKGGCGKTTTAINLGASLGRAGTRTLLVDLDPQSHCAAGLGVPDARVEHDTSDLLRQGSHPAFDGSRLVWRAARNLDLIPSRVRLAGLESPSSDFARRDRRERSLERALVPFADRYDVCLLDCPPAIGLLTFNALVAADMVLIPVETGYFAIQGAARQLATVRAVAKRLDTRLRCVVLPTLHEPGLAVADDLLDELQRRFKSRVLPVTIRRDPALREAASFGRPITEHASGSMGSRDYAALASILVESEQIGLGGVDEEDWSDVEQASGSPMPRPGAAGGDSREETPASEAGGAGYAFGGAGMVSSVTASDHTVVGQVIVTLSGGGVEQGLARRLEDAAPPQGRTRAEELARRTTARPCGTPVRRQETVEIPSGHARRLGVQTIDAGVVFVQPRALGREVSVSGDFNGWTPVRLALNEGANVHELCLRLPAGRHQYRLHVDGHDIADPYNTDWTLNERGEPNSIVEVAEADTPSGYEDHRCGAD